MDVINIKNLELFAKHGVYPEENSLGQKFIISAALYMDLRKAGTSDELDNALDYGKVCITIKRFVESSIYKLIESVAEHLAEKLLIENTALRKVWLEIKKPWAPVSMHLETVSVEIVRQWHTAHIAIGSNIGNKEGYLQFAVDELNKRENCRVKKVSSFITTKPYGYTDQDEFLNGCLEVETLLMPRELLELLHEIENTAVRERSIRWGPRTLDLDIIFYDDLVYSDEELTIPHVEAHKRDFVLLPLREISPYKIHPTKMKTVTELLEELLT